MAVLLCSPVQGQVLNLTRTEGINLARGLFLNGDAALANAIARRLLEADPFDVEALLLLSASEEALGNAVAALQYGRRAWEAAQRGNRPAPLRYEIARQTAHAAVSAGRIGAAEVWLSRAERIAPGPEQADQTRKDREFIAANVPFSANLTVQITPTSNINGGSVTDVFLVDDVVIGSLSGWSEAQPGLIGTASLDLIRDVPAGGRDRIGLTLTETLPVLAPWAARANPDLDASDLEQRAAVLRFEHDFRLPAGGASSRATISASQSWTGGAAAGPALRGRLEVALPGGDETALLLTAIAERQWSEGQGGITDGLVLNLDASHPLPQLGGTIQAGLSASALRSDWVNTSFDSLGATIGWVADEPAAGVNWSVLMTGGWTSYDRFQPIGGGIDATNGRTDTSLGLRLSLRPDEKTIFGLTPFAALSHDLTWSNISRYQTENSAISLGLSQEF